MIPSRPFIVRGLYEWILENGWTPYVVVDADCPGVEVPRQHVQDGQIVLNISPTAVQYLNVANAEMTFNARFGGVPMQVIAPMAAILAMYARENGQGMGFGMEPGADQLEQQLLEKVTDEIAPAGLSVVEDSSGAEEAEIQSEESVAEVPKKSDKPHKRPSLKVIK
ncbi:ClpXP protease specificity-enhancing factor [Pokkaliibacter sp. CJK22405]|uniref:ClpXP protease specificity-enhancing factor n=1 Tax=Pokkaliibacter sp. CJK22405 TaxID=3384615 RepID=UPI00398541F6